MVSYGAAVIALTVFSPNFAFASKANRRFENTTELQLAVAQYNGDDDACISSADGSRCDVGQTYGWPMNTWNVSEITDMSYVFYYHASFNEDISDLNMHNMFSGHHSFNEDISDWVVSQVTDMSQMFLGASSFNGDLSKWEVSKVTSMWGMFDGASSFNRDLSDWNVSKVTDMHYMFWRATSFNSDLSEWDTSQVKYMFTMFQRATSFNRDLSEWDISKVRDMNYMFENATSFNQDLCAWNDKFTPQCTNDMFKDSGCTFQDDPDKLEGGPWCASPCQEDENDGVSTVASTNAITVIAATLIFVQNML